MGESSYLIGPALLDYRGVERNQTCHIPHAHGVRLALFGNRRLDWI